MQDAAVNETEKSCTPGELGSSTTHKDTCQAVMSAVKKKIKGRGQRVMVQRHVLLRTLTEVGWREARIPWGRLVQGEEAAITKALKQEDPGEVGANQGRGCITDNLREDGGEHSSQCRDSGSYCK